MACFLFIPSTFAQAQVAARNCDCFCATKEGTKPPGGGAIKVLSVSDCQNACKAQKDKMAVCAFDLTQYPAQNQSCFTQEQCKKAVEEYCGDSASKDETSSVVCKSKDDSFDTYQPPECMPGSHYCYAPKNSTNVRLNIQIGGLIKVDNLETYVGTLFRWMEGAGILTAIVFIMVGGLQYALGGVSSDQLSKGKKRIQTSVMGLILLICSIVIIELINPQLSSVSVPRLPMIKTINVTGAGKSCETLADIEKFKVATITPGSNNAVQTVYTGQHTNSFQCGKIGMITGGPNNTEVAAGISCNFTYCPYENNLGKAKERCIGGGPQAKCLTCGKIFDGSDDLEGTAIQPSASLCGQFTVGPIGGTPEQPASIERCVWTKDGDFNNGAGVVKATSSGACAYMKMDCEAIRKVGCKGYADVMLNNVAEGDESLTAADTDPEEIAGCGGSCSNFSYKTICEENPCGIPGGCKMPIVIKNKLSKDMRLACMPAVAGAIIEAVVK